MLVSPKIFGETRIVDKMATPSRIEDRASQAVKTLEQVWEVLRLVQPDIPPAVLLLLDSRSRRRTFGHFANSCWRYLEEQRAHEVAVSPELFDAPEELLATLAHEAAHAVNHVRGVRDTGPDGYYHLTAFRDTCRALQLECAFTNRRYGWTATRWPAGAGVPACYQQAFDLLRMELPSGTEVQKHPVWCPGELPRPGHVRLVCLCRASHRSVYVNRATLNDSGITCSFCGAPFQVPST